MKKFVFFVLSLLFFFTSSSPKAFAITNTKPYGGRVLYTEVCTCMEGWTLVYVGPPNGGAFMYGPPTQLKMYYNYWGSPWQLGYYDDSGDSISCEIYVGESCSSAGSGPLSLMVGTSAY